MVGAYGFCRKFLDELPEFGSRVLEVLRQPLEDKTVSIARSTGTLNFPANFMLIGAANPCPHGYAGVFTYYQEAVSKFSRQCPRLNGKWT